MNWEQAITIELDLEGGARLVRDTGGLTKYGISQNAFPNEDIANLTEARAKVLYYTKYWSPAGCDFAPDDMKLALFDCAINQGVNFALELYADHKDLKSFLDARAARYRALAGSNPDKYGKYLNGWLNRLNRVYNYTVQAQSAQVPATPPLGVEAALPSENTIAVGPQSSIMDTVEAAGGAGGIYEEASSLWQSKIAWASGGVGGASAASTVHNDPTLQSLLWQLVHIPSFWMIVAIVVLVSYIIYWRWKDHGRGRY